MSNFKMMKFLFSSLAILLFSSLSSMAQTPAWAWAKSAGNNDFDEANSICTDRTGNIYSAGYFHSDSIIFGNTTLINSGDYDMFLTKYDNNGNVLWAKRAGNYDYDVALGVATDIANNVYVTGCFYDTLITFDSISLLNSYDSIGHGDFFIVKYDSSGNVIWAISDGGRNDDQSYSINTDAFCNVYVSGFFTSDSLFFGNDTLLNTDISSCHCDIDFFIAKYDSSGNFLWAKKGGPVALVNNYPSTIDKWGNVYVTGCFIEASITIDTVTIFNSSNPLSTDMFIAKYDSNGNLIWTRNSTGTYDEIPNSIIADTFGNIYLGGQIDLLTHTFGSITLTNMGGQDAFLAKYDSNGNVIWAQSYGDNYNDVIHSLAMDAIGNIYFAGYFGSPSVTIGPFILQNPGLLIAKLDSGGSAIWALEPSGGITKNEIATDGFNNLYVTGSFYAATINFGSYQLANAGGFADMYIAKLGTSVGINKINVSDLNFSISPNPSRYNLLIASKNTEFKINKIIISNIVGKKIMEISTGNINSYLLDVSNLVSGVYFISVKTSAGQMLKKFIRQ
jgi:hypothetical protein